MNYLINNREYFTGERQQNQGCNKVLTALFLLAAFVVTVVLPMKNISAKEKIDFSGYTWQVKHSVDYSIGPGPNYWSASGRNVEVDEAGHLHLRLNEHRGRWYATEV